MPKWLSNGRLTLPTNTVRKIHKTILGVIPPEK